MWASRLFDRQPVADGAGGVSVGFVVDDAIVMIENAFRNLEQGMSPLRAAHRRARSRSASPLCRFRVSLIAAFIPLLFMGGIVGRLFREFSVTLALCDRHFDGGVAVGDADDLRLLRASAAEP